MMTQQPSQPSQTIDPNFINRIFGAEGPFAQSVPGYEQRDAQVQLSNAIYDAMMKRRFLLAEGPCGTGKSFAYLVPAIKIAKDRDCRVVIATANIALQEQLVQKDLPALQKLLNIDFKFALMKGKNNYYCPARMEEEAHSLDPLIDDNDIAQMDDIELWGETTDTGDKSDLSFQPKDMIWSRVCGSSNDCDGEQCRETQCFALRARHKAEMANVIVTNYHILFSDIAVQMAGGSGFVPQYNYLICDEGHEMAEIARDFFGTKLGMFWFRRMRKALDRFGERTLGDDLYKVAENFFATLKKGAEDRSYKARIRGKDFVPSEALVTLLTKTVDFWNHYFSADEKQQRETLKLRSRSLKALIHLQGAMNLENNNLVYFVDVERERANLCSKVIDPSEIIREQLLDTVESAVITSATLTTGGSFNFIKAQLGLTDFGGKTEALCVEVKSPFDFSEQALLVCPSMVKAPPENGYQDEVARQFYFLVQAAQGRTLGLFTSYKVMNAVADYLRRCDKDNFPWRLLVQGDMPRTKLVEEFRRDTHSVLIGVSSLWTGVDVQGEALSCLAIDRLPFPNPTDPVMDALTDRDEKWFFTQSIPRAVITFRQGFGRLIRSKLDTGVIVVFDKRMVEKPYGRQFTKSLPNIQFSRDFAHVKEFIDLCDAERASRSA